MFDFNFKNSNGLTSTQENEVRRVVNQKYFEIDEMIDYLDNHEIITEEIFSRCMTTRGLKKIRITFLKNFKPVKRDIFIKRLYIYLFDLNFECNYTMSELFESYKDYKNEDEEVDDEQFDYEGLYLILEKVYLTYGIPLDRVFDYLYEQFGSLLEFQSFYKWICYIELLVVENEKDVFPKNLLYSYNKLLVNKDLKPLIYRPNMCNVRIEENKRMIVSGIFPKDDDGNICFEWVGVWCENVGEIKQIKRNKNSDEYSMEEKILKRFGLNINISFYIELKPESKVFFIEENECETPVWKLTYAGSKVSEFNNKKLVRAREKMKLSQREVCDMCDINLRSYQRMEAGEAIPGGLDLLRLMDCLDVRDIKDFMKKDRITDPGYEKFNSGLAPSSFVNA